MSTIKLLELRDLPIDDLQPLVEESREEGFEFLDRLVTEYRDGTNIFQKKGEALFALYHQQKMIAVGGINRDPYLPNKKDTARVRHLYVLAFWRKRA